MTTEAGVVIADDEPLARRMLRRCLRDLDWIGDVHEAADGLAAIRAVDTFRPALLLLDIRMPGASGISVVERIEHRPYIVFTTAFDRYAVTAFEIGALDYLLKPFGRERVLSMLERARAALDHGGPPLVARASSVLSSATPLRQVFVKERGRMVAVELADVERLEASDDYVTLCVGAQRHLVQARLHDLHARLDPAQFIRVHRCHVVGRAFIAALEPRDGARLTVIMRSGDRVPASRAGSAELRKLAL